MSKYAIARIKKLKTIPKISAAGKHNSRADHAPNADPNRKCVKLGGLNEPESAFNRLMSLHNIKPRKNAVLAVELLFTFSPEMKKNIKISDWVNENKAFFDKEFGKENVLSAHLHLDETTPHIQLIFCPIIKKTVRGKEQSRLACKDFFGTPKKLRAYQDRYAEHMSKFGLERGIRGSKAHHKEVKKYYSELKEEINIAQKQMEEFERKMPEKPSIFNVKNVYNSMKNMLKNFKTVLLQAGKVPILEQRFKKMEEQNKLLKSAINTIKQALGTGDLEDIIGVLVAERDKRDDEIQKEYESSNAKSPLKNLEKVENKPIHQNRPKTKGNGEEFTF